MRGAEAAAAQEKFLALQVFEKRLQHIACEPQPLHMGTKVICHHWSVDKELKKCAQAGWNDKEWLGWTAS